MAKRVDREVRAGGSGEAAKMQRQIDALVAAFHAMEQGREQPAPHYLFERDALEVHGVSSALSGLSLAHMLGGMASISPAGVRSGVVALDEWVSLDAERWAASTSVAQRACLLAGRMHISDAPLDWFLNWHSWNSTCLELVEDRGNAPLLPTWLVDRFPRRHGGLGVGAFLVGTHVASAISGFAALQWNQFVSAPSSTPLTGPSDVFAAVSALREILLAPSPSLQSLLSIIQLEAAILLWQTLHLQSWKAAVDKVQEFGLLGDLFLLVVPFTQYPMGRIAGWAVGIAWGLLHETTPFLPDFAPKIEKSGPSRIAHA